VEELLLAWFAAEGRDLPWRLTHEPYAILVSEVMLQQTQVPRVVPRYLEWLERWPTVEALAAASRAEVIRAWQGLGYNRRAVNLHRAAQRVAAEGWPEDLTVLPGVGRYTADALRAFAFGEPVLAVDTNVRRVQERTAFPFTHRAGQACPSRGRRYEPARRQGPLAGSFRERRARTLRTVAAGARPVAALDEEAVASLAADGLVDVRAGSVSLPA
jgi:3-methyladenine DNA glycosylase/8-oxoguanine DNA glycosylase